MITKKRLFLAWLMIHFFGATSEGALISRTYTYSSGNTITANENNTNENTMYTEFNGNIESANIKDGTIVAGDIADTTITGAKINTSNFTVTLSSINVTTLYGSSVTYAHVLGVTDGSTPTVGSYGEYTSSYTTNRQGYTTTAWKNLAQIILTPGDWDITGSALCTSASNIQEIDYAVSSNSGTTTTDHVAGHNETWVVNASTSVGTIANYRGSITSNTTYYLKNIIYFSAGTPACNGRVSARRMR